MSGLDTWVAAWWHWMTTLSWQIAWLTVLAMVASLALRAAPPRFRHTLWLLVLVKVFLPTSLTAPWSVGHWLDKSASAVTESIGASPDRIRFDFRSERPTLVPANGSDVSHASHRLLFAVWTIGVIISAAVVAYHYRWFLKRLTEQQVVDEGPLMVAVEQAALKLQIERVPEIHVSDEDTSPYLIGTLRPCIVIPKSFVNQMTPDELHPVLLHELTHIWHRDTWIGWLQVIAQCLLWFHPFVWLANTCLRHEREKLCDDAVLRSSGVHPDVYGQTLLRVLTVARSRSLATGSLVGVFERGGQIQNRLESIMRFNSHQQRPNWPWGIAVAAFALLFLPMGRWADAAAAAAGQVETTDTVATDKAATDNAATERRNDVPVSTTPYPQIVETQPAAGSTDVDPELKELRVTFDRDMSDGMSWTGGGQEFPPVDKSRKAHWINKRTCVLPVKLEKAMYYRVGLNSKSFGNFKSVDGSATPPSAIFFTTRGASDAQQNRVRIPQVVEMSPENEAQDVSPKTNVVRVTFSMAMGEGMSWTGGGETFPAVPEGRRAKWSKDGRTCELPVSLKPNHEYRLGLNSLSHNNFQSRWGVPLKPVVYTFRTSDSGR
ncbi:MAG: M56 family metallopeptidase [Planctomycetaceae bacterium]